MQATLVRGATIKLLFGRIQQSRDAVDARVLAATLEGGDVDGKAGAGPPLRSLL
jgi:hypothetical protein